MKRIEHTSKLPGNKKDLGNDMTASKLTFMHYIEVFRMVKVTVKYLPDVALSSLLHGGWWYKWSYWTHTERRSTHILSFSPN